MSRKKDYQTIFASNAGVSLAIHSSNKKEQALADLSINLPVLSEITGKEIITTKKICIEVKADAAETTRELYKQAYLILRKYLRHISKEVFGMMPSAVGEDDRVGIFKKDAYDWPHYTGPFYSVHFIARTSKLKKKKSSNLFSGHADNLIGAYEEAWKSLAAGIIM